MRKTPRLLLSIFAIATILISCSKEDPQPVDPLVGNWLTEKVELIVPNVAPHTATVNSECTDKSYLILGAGDAFEQGDVDSKTCELKKKIGTWKKTDNSLEISLPTGSGTLDIISVTDNKLVLRRTNLPSVPAESYLEMTYSK
jgi:hypothetical protein